MYAGVSELPYCVQQARIVFERKGKGSMELLHTVQSNRPKMASSGTNVKTICMLIKKDCSLTCHQIAVIMDCSRSSIENNMTQAGHTFYTLGTTDFATTWVKWKER